MATADTLTPEFLADLVSKAIEIACAPLVKRISALEAQIDAKEIAKEFASALGAPDVTTRR